MELNGTNGHRIQDSGTKHTGQRLKIVDNGGLHKHTLCIWRMAPGTGHMPVGTLEELGAWSMLVVASINK